MVVVQEQLTKRKILKAPVICPQISVVANILRRPWNARTCSVSMKKEQIELHSLPLSLLSANT